jgi:hypothetical protein
MNNFFPHYSTEWLEMYSIPVCTVTTAENYFTPFAGFFWGSAAFCYFHCLLHEERTKRFSPSTTPSIHTTNLQ